MNCGRGHGPEDWVELPEGNALDESYCRRCAEDRALIERTVQVAIEKCYLQARGHEQGDGFQRHGTRQLYWKGRSDAATEIRQIVPGQMDQIIEEVLLKAR